MTRQTLLHRQSFQIYTKLAQCVLIHPIASPFLLQLSIHSFLVAPSTIAKKIMYSPKLYFIYYIRIDALFQVLYKIHDYSKNGYRNFSIHFYCVTYIHLPDEYMEYQDKKQHNRCSNTSEYPKIKKPLLFGVHVK